MKVSRWSETGVESEGREVVGRLCLLDESDVRCFEDRTTQLTQHTPTLSRCAP